MEQTESSKLTLSAQISTYKFSRLMSIHFHFRAPIRNFLWCYYRWLITPFAVHYEKIRIHLRETATNSTKIHSLARKSEHLRINQIQLQFLHFNQHSITFLGIHFRHLTYKREKHTFINANIRVINIILKSLGTIDKHLRANAIH